MDGMYGYIDAGKLMDFANNHVAGIDSNDIARFPRADVKAIVHGKWIKDKTQVRGDGKIYDYCCSICENLALPGSYNNNDNLTSFCPWCGADMTESKGE